MDSYTRVSPWIYLLFLCFSVWNVSAGDRRNNFIVTRFGAVSDGITDNKQALADAWKRACETNGGMVSVPKGTFFLSGGEFLGPCNGRTLFYIAGTLKAFSDEPTPINPHFWLTFSSVDRLKLFGNGVIDGNGASSWSRCKQSAQCKNRPATVKINSASNVLIRDLNLINSKMFHFHIYGSKNITVKDVDITAPENSPNTDGIHIGNSEAVRVLDSHIATGDDCVSMGHGTRNVNVSGVWCGPGHGISIGSLGRNLGENDVTGITVRNCTLSATQNGLRIKTWAPSLSSNVVSDVTFADINIDGVRNPIIIDQYYCPSGSCRHEAESAVEIKGVKYVGVRGSSSSETSVKILCSKWKRCRDVEFVGLDITFKGRPTSAACSSVDGKFQGSNQVPSRCS